MKRWREKWKRDGKDEREMKGVIKGEKRETERWGEIEGEKRERQERKIERYLEGRREEMEDKGMRWGEG